MTAIPWAAALPLLSVLATLIATGPTHGDEPDPGTPGWFSRHVFDGRDGCMAVRRGQSLRPNDEVLVFAAGEKPVLRRIEYVIAGDSLKPIFDERHFQGVHEDKDLWARIGCYWGLGMMADPPADSIARYGSWAGEALAIEGLPRATLAAGGDGRPLDSRELADLTRRVAADLPAGYSDSTSLLAGRCYESVPGHRLVELVLGRPFGVTKNDGAVMDSVQMCRIFFDNEDALCFACLSRVSGQEEHVDTEAPELTRDNWFQNIDDTLGFISFDKGATWSRLSVSAGLEGLSYAITGLGPGMPELWGFHLYTNH